MSRVSGRQYFLYILWSRSGQRFYIGITEDVPQRLQQHNYGDLKSWTKRHRPWELVLTEAFPDFHSARLRELKLKRQKGGVGFYALTGLNPTTFK